MSTPEQPDSQPLTRKQLREIRNTGATPVIDPAAAAAEAEVATAIAVDDVPVAPPPVEASLAPVAPLARPAEPIVLPEPPVPDRSVDLGVAPLTRRQARQQERIRTASVPVITPDVAAAYAAQSAADPVPNLAPPEALNPVIDAVPQAPARADVDAEVAKEDPFAILGVTSGSVPISLPSVEAEPEPTPDREPSAPDAVVSAVDEPVDEQLDEVEDEHETDAEHDVDWPFPVEDADDHPAGEAEADSEAPRVVDPAFGAALLAGDAPAPQKLESSFDDLITRSANGSVATPNALILSQSPDGGPIVAPVTATGEILITGTFNLPEGLGSTGHAPGTADGKEVDAVLVDGELPAHSSPTPIAASSAISTVKTPGEIIKPPAPEKGGRLMLTLAITAGVLALALVGVLILAFATGVF